MQNTSIRILLYINKNTICIIDLLHLICYVCMYIFMTVCTNATFCQRCRETSEHDTMKCELNILPLPTTASVLLVRSIRWSSNVLLRYQQFQTGGQTRLRAEADGVGLWLPVTAADMNL